LKNPYFFSTTTLNVNIILIQPLLPQDEHRHIIKLPALITRSGIPRKGQKKSLRTGDECYKMVGNEMDSENQLNLK
jgi:hypothetical protein